MARKKTNELQSNQSNEEKIGLGEKLAFGSGDVALNVIWSSVAAFLVYFYTDVAGIAAAAVGTIMLVVRLLDGIQDLGVGIMVDITKSKFGKARPWLLWMAIPFGVCTVLLFTVFDFSPLGKEIYAFITYTLVAFIYSAIAIPYGVLNSMITKNQYQRSVLNLFRMIMAMITSLVISVFTMDFIKKFGGGPQAWQNVFIIYAVIAVILFLITFRFTKERVKRAYSEAKIPVVQVIKMLFKNKYWVMILCLAITLYIINGTLGSFAYYAQYVLGDLTLVSLLMMSTLLPLILTMFFIAKPIKKFGKRNVALLGSTIALIGGIVTILNPTDLSTILIGNVIKGIGIAPLTGTLFAFVADTIEYGEWRNGIRTEGLIYSAASLGTKVGMGLGAAMIGWLLAAGG